jgi:hypothetical protein
MTLKIDREALPISPDEFGKVVAAHIAALSEYDEHLAGVREDEANEQLKPEDRRVVFPAPSASALVEEAIRQEKQDDGRTHFVADYEMVGPSLSVRKQRLVQQVSEAEGAELAKVVPPGKIRYFHLRYAQIMRDDAERLHVHLIEGNDHPGDVEAFQRQFRPEDDSRFLDEYDDRARVQTAVNTWAAKAHHDIEDLTEETVDGWKLEPFVG